MRTRAALLAVSALALTIAAAPRQDAGSRSRDAFDHPPTTAPTTAPTSRPTAALILGTFKGTVVDDDETVPCVTTFLDYHGHITGKYVVRAGADDQYEGTLDNYKLLDDARHECRFRWHDKHGDGFATLRLSDDGTSFAGSWGLEVVQEKLTWSGQRKLPPAPAAPTTRSMHGSNGP